MTNRNGFTLIELVVTLAVSGIFFTLAMNMYVTANGAFTGYRKTHEAYFEHNVRAAVANRMLRDNRGTCDGGEFRFAGEAADSLDRAVPFPAPRCKRIDRDRILVYFLGKADSASRELQGFSGTCHTSPYN